MDCSSLPGLKRTALPGGMETSAPVRGLRPDAGFPGAHVEYAKTAQFDAIAGGERLLHALEDGFDGEFCLGLGDSGAVDDFVDDVELNQGIPRVPRICVAQVIDAKGDRTDCQPGDQSRNMAGTSQETICDFAIWKFRDLKSVCTGIRRRADALSELPNCRIIQLANP